MADPLTLVILLAAGEAASPTASAMAQGARDAFAGVVAEVQESPTVPTDADALTVEGESHPDAVAELVWHDVDRRHATLRVHLRQGRRWIERSFVFGASDPAVERGRTLGFAVASILPELGARPSASGAAPAATATNPAAGTSTPSRTAPASPATASATPTGPAPAGCTPDAGTACPPAQPSAPGALSSAPAPSLPASPPTVAAPVSSGVASGRSRSTADRELGAPKAPPAAGFREPHLAVDLLAVGATALGSAGIANSAGGAGAVEWFAHTRLSLRLGGSVRAGELDVAEAHVTNLLASAGVVLLVVRPTPSLPFAATLRADYLLEHESATHFDSDDPSPVTRGRWVSGLDAFADVSLLLSSQIAAVMGFGLEDVWAPTYVYVRDVQVATVPRLRALLEAGFQLRF